MLKKIAFPALLSMVVVFTVLGCDGSSSDLESGAKATYAPAEEVASVDEEKSDALSLVVKNNQVVQCTDGGCTLFALECRTGGGDVVCYNAHSNVEPSSKQVRKCEHWKHMTDWLCNRDLPAKKPCLNAEKKMLKECTYVPTTVCVDDPNTIPDIVMAGPDVCMGDCTEVLEKINDPEGPQPICTDSF